MAVTLFRGILILVGGVIMLIGINVGGGGIQTLGLQGDTSFLDVTNEPRYLVQDNHVRFLGGLFGAIGIFFILATSNLRRYQSVLMVLFTVIFLGGLTRFSSARPDVIFSADVMVSALTELVLMPILYLWLPRVVKQLPTPSPP
jgi:hypothetical protein